MRPGGYLAKRAAVVAARGWLAKRKAIFRLASVKGLTLSADS